MNRESRKIGLEMTIDGPTNQKKPALTVVSAAMKPAFDPIRLTIQPEDSDIAK
jgi:hypothetical protein